MASTTQDTSSTSHAAFQHKIVVALVPVANMMGEIADHWFQHAFLRARQDEEDADSHYRVANIEAHLFRIFSHEFQGWMPMLPLTAGAV